MMPADIGIKPFHNDRYGHFCIAGLLSHILFR